MIPVIMLAINTGAFSSSPFLTLPYPSSFESFPVIYLFTVAAIAWLVIAFEAGRPGKNASLINDIINNTMLANVVLSLLVNIFATSIIAVKAWYVPSRWSCPSIILLTTP